MMMTPSITTTIMIIVIIITMISISIISSGGSSRLFIITIAYAFCKRPGHLRGAGGSTQCRATKCGDIRATSHITKESIV